MYPMIVDVLLHPCFAHTVLLAGRTERFFFVAHDVLHHTPCQCGETSRDALKCCVRSMNCRLTCRDKAPSLSLRTALNGRINVPASRIEHLVARGRGDFQIP